MELFLAGYQFQLHIIQTLFSNHYINSSICLFHLNYMDIILNSVLFSSSASSDHAE